MTSDVGDPHWMGRHGWRQEDWWPIAKPTLFFVGNFCADADPRPGGGVVAGAVASGIRGIAVAAMVARVRFFLTMTLVEIAELQKTFEVSVSNGLRRPRGKHLQRVCQEGEKQI
ncbi:hypothetical protein LX32DRAFT_1872 [Colletotrichum zoysiae]|uniref:Uncharacterized protein n=1 Tax=Colletotrichum zoysiae TaxID=1216348 RepID=A0AAD9HVV4_9PEZI|nr:hypothetical protein LX32DRAFT_1872 [Colletotrichum zoysiae]